MSGNALHIEIDGDVTLERLAEILGATNELLREVTREVTGDPDAVRWLLTDLQTGDDQPSAEDGGEQPKETDSSDSQP